MKRSYIRRLSTLCLPVLIASLFITQLLAEDTTHVFLNGTVLTVDAKFSEHEALAIRGKRILAVGGKEAVLKAAGEQAQIIDAGGKVILPAFIDAHCHPVLGGQIATTFEPVGQLRFRSVEEALERMEEVGRAAKPDDWLLFRDVDLATQTFGEETLTIKHLDAVSKEAPVFVFHAGGHVATANSRMLEIMGVTAETRDPKGARYGRFEDGRPNGMLYAAGVIAPALGKLKPFREYDYVQGTIGLAPDWLQKGFGTLGVTGIGTVGGTRHWTIFRQLAENGDFPFRSRIYLQAELLEEFDAADIKPGVGDERVRVVGYKISADGSNQARTGLQRQPYLGSNDRGLAYMTEEDVMTTVASISRRGHQLAMHGNGDAAIDRIIRAVAGARSEGIEVNRPRIEHCSIVQDDQIGKLIDNDISGSFLIAHVRYWGKAFRDDVFGLEKAVRLDRAGSFERADIPFSLHTDFGVSELSPMEMVEIAVTRTLFTESDYVLGKEECSSVEAALRGVTSTAAWQLQSEAEVGSLEKGKFADLVVLDADPRNVDTNSISDIMVLETWIDGEKVFDRDEKRSSSQDSAAKSLTDIDFDKLKGLDYRSEADKRADREFMKKFADVPVVDMLIPGSPQSYVDPTIKGFEDMAKMSRDWGFSYVTYSAAVDEWIDPAIVIDKIANGRNHWLDNPEKYILVDTVDDIRRAKKEGKLAVSFNFQGSNALGRNLSMIGIYYRLGVRQFAFCYNARNFMAEGAMVDPKRDAGLSEMGKKMVAVMNDVGMVIDCSHASDQTAIDAAEVSTKPIIMSHSNPKGVYDIRRNASDDAIRAVAKTGGVVAINGIGGFLSEGQEDVSGEMLARHAHYVGELVGREHVAWGSDYVHDIGAALRLIASNPVAWPKEAYSTKAAIPVCAAPGAIWSAARVLQEEYGWSDNEIRGFLGENAFRVYEANWRPSR